MNTQEDPLNMSKTANKEGAQMGQQGSFTPGPWDLQSPMEDQSGSDVIVASGIKGSYPVICELSYEVPPQERRANARLIASAPELLEALKTIAAVIGGPPGWQAELAKTAIAKAEGKGV